MEWAAAPSALAGRIPPKNPSTVLLGLRLGAVLWGAEKFSEDVLENIAELGDGDEEEKEFGILVFVSGNVEIKQRGRVAEGINADHEGPLDFGGAFEEAFGIAGEGGAQRDEKEGINGNENGEEAIPVFVDEGVMERRDDEECPEKRAMIAAARRC